MKRPWWKRVSGAWMLVGVHRRRNPATTNRPGAPNHVHPKKKLPPKGSPRPKRTKPKHEMTHDEKLALLAKIVDWELAHRGNLIYSENWLLRKQFFHSRWWKVKNKRCDCSQFVAGCLNDAGFDGFTDSDYTGSEWAKGKVVAKATRGCFLIWGAYPGQHTAFADGTGWTIGFGGPGGPDHVSEADMAAYFARQGHPGVRIIQPL